MKRRCVFLDRDGVINVAPRPTDYVLSWEKFEFLPTITDWIRLFNTLGYLVIVVTNQRCIAQGLVTQEEVDEMHQRMVAALKGREARIDDVYCCPHEEGECDCRKPRTGMVEAAAEKWAIELGESILIGDSDRDEGLAKNAGLRFVRVHSGRIVD